MWKKVISTCVGCALILGIFVGVSKFLPKQESITIDENAQSSLDVMGSAVETVKDAPLEEQNKGPFEVAAKGPVLIDASTGQVLFQQDSHKELPLASVTKVMTMLLVRSLWMQAR